MSLLLSCFYFFYFSIVAVYLIFMPNVLYEIGYSASEVGIIFAAGPLVRFLLPFLFIKGLKLNTKIFNFALLLMPISSISFYVFVHNFYMLLVSNIFLGIALGLTLPYIEIVSLEKLGKQKYGKIRLFGSVGFILVALVLVKVISKTTMALDFLLTLTFITALVSFLISKKINKQASVNNEVVQNDIKLLRDWKLWGGLILMQMSFGAFYNFFTIYSTNNGISLNMTVYLWSFGVVVEILMLFFQAKLLKKNLIFILQFTTFMTAVRWFLVFKYPHNIEMLFFTQSIHALSFALFHSAAISYLFEFYKHKSLAQQFFLGITYGLGGLIGALLSGYIYQFYPEYLFLSSSFMAFGAFIFLRLWGKSKMKFVYIS